MHNRARRIGWLASLMAVMVSASFAISSPPVEASTTNQTVRHASGRVAGEAWWNSGNHRSHAHGSSGFNSFTIADKVCRDGWAIGVEWRIGGRRYEQRLRRDCGPREITFNTGHATRTMRQFSWRVFMWDTNGESPTKYAGYKTDWMGSDGKCTSRWMTRSTVYNDHEPNNERRKHYTVTLWPSDAARRVDPRPGPTERATNDMWSALQQCTPLPGFFTDDQRESLRQQLKCHIRFARDEELGGATWDLESHRPTADALERNNPRNRCNWGGGDRSS